MKSRTIKSILRRKVSAWIESIEDESLRKLLEENVIVTGGSIVSMLLNEDVNDYDIYLRTKESAFRVAEYYVKKHNENHPKIPASIEDVHKNDVSIDRLDSVDRFKIVIQSDGVGGDPLRADEYDIEDAAEIAEDTESEPSYRVTYVTSNAITLSDKIQIVVRFFGEPEEIHKNYDFIHCTNYWKSWDGELVLHPKALECIINRELFYSGSLYPICSIFRVRKFIKRGWTITAGQLMKAMMQISELNLNDLDVLEDQMIGVDSAYFADLIQKCRDRMKETGADSVDQNYLMRLIDQIF